MFPLRDVNTLGPGKKCSHKRFTSQRSFHNVKDGNMGQGKRVHISRQDLSQD